jgi:hypothetical protein
MCGCCYCSDVHNIDICHVCVLDTPCSVACCWWQWCFICKINCFVSSQLQCLLTSTGYWPRLHIVRILDKSAMRNEVVCVALSAANKKFFDRL